MTRTFWQTLFGGIFFVAQPAAAETLLHRAENQVPVVIVEIKRPAEHTEIHLQAQAPLTKVCFAASGPNSPYLLASVRNYRYLGGENITSCPERRDYAASEVMILRFEISCGRIEHVLVRVGSGWRKAADRCRLPDHAVLEFSTCEVELKGGLDLTSLAD